MEWSSGGVSVWVTPTVNELMNSSTTVSTHTTEDIVNAGCLTNPFSTVACARYITMAVVIFITGVLCVYRVVRLHIVRHEALHHYLVFYSYTLVCILCVIHWILGDYAQLDFLAQWFKQIVYLVVTHFFWTRAHRAIRRERLTNFCLLPGLMVGLIYCTTTVILGLVMVNDYKAACLAIEWVMMSSAEVLIAQMFLLAGFFISKRLDSISTIQSVRTSQKRKLWSLVIVFEISALVAFGYDLSMLAIGSKYDNCGRIFNFNQVLYSPIFGTFMIIKFALPIWVLLATLEPIPASPLTDDDDTDSYQTTSDSHSILPQRRTLYRPTLFRPSRTRGSDASLNNSGILTPVSEENNSPHVSRIINDPS